MKKILVVLLMVALLSGAAVPALAHSNTTDNSQLIQQILAFLNANPNFLAILRALLNRQNTLVTSNSPTPSTPSITVTSPNGGETVSNSGTLTVRWTSLSLSPEAKVSVDLWNANGGYITLLSDEINDGLATINLNPNTVPPGSYKVNVCSPSPRGNGVCDYSDNIFTITSGGNQPTPADPGSVKLNLSVTPSSVSVGANPVVAWSVTGATSCTASGDWSGSKNPAGGTYLPLNLSAGTYSYTLTCFNNEGRTTDKTVRLTVSALPVPPPPPTANFYWGDSVSNTALTVTQGETAWLHWLSEGASSCQSGSWPASPWSTANPGLQGDFGFRATMPGTYTLNLSCGNQSGSVVKTVTVTVNPAPAAPASLTVSRPNGGESYRAGDRRRIEWRGVNLSDSVNLSYCTANNSTVSTTSCVPIVSNLPPSASQYDWTIPTSVAAGSYWIRVISGAVSDMSDGAFQIQPR